MTKNVLIEKTAAELAATFYEACRSSGMTSKHKNARSYAKANIEKFIPKAIELLMSMMTMDHISDVLKNEIYEAFLERSNDPELAMFDQKPKSVLHLH